MIARATGCMALLGAFALSCSNPPPPVDAGTNDYELDPTDNPFPGGLELNARVRNIIVSYEDRVGASHAGTACGVSAMLFDVRQGFTIVPTTIDAASNCRLYANGAPEREYARQAFVCAGVIAVTSGTSAGGDAAPPLAEQFVLCPLMGTTSVPYESPFTSCRGLAGGSTATVSSGLDMDVEGDAVPDLNVQATLPSNVQITVPPQPIFTWPEVGDLEVRWVSRNASTAVVRVDGTGTGIQPAIICNPSHNGILRIPGSLVTQVGFRMRDAKLTVMSLRGVNALAEGMRPYRIYGATVSSVTLQARH